MMRRPTFSELRWPMDNDSLTFAEHWVKGISNQILEWTWRAFDQLEIKHLAYVDLTQPLDQLERDLTSKHFIEIQRLFSLETDGYSSVVPSHEWPEHETRPGGSGKPPAYDLAFVCYDNQRIAFPIEAKVLSTTGALADYLGDVEKFTNGIAAPIIGEGALIAYLLSGASAEFFTELATRLKQTMGEVELFSTRPHRTSRHIRDFAPELHLHHMAMRLYGKKSASH